AYDCRPYAGTSAEVCSGTVPAGVTQLFVGVNGYAATSNFKVDVTTGAALPTKYAFNDKAATFTYFRTDVQYISESNQSTDGNLASTIDTYTRTDHYEYILEIDATGAIIGGEWVGESKKKHPNFVGLPLAVSQPSVAGGKITYAQVKELVDLSVASETPVPQPGSEKTVNESGTLAKGDVKSYGPFKAGNGSFSAVLSGTGDADLYVRKALAPTVSLYDCRPYKNGSGESCTITASGDVYVNVRGYATTSTYQLVIKYTEATSTP
ncbi:MAG: pre-peptidase C-terminal domain-containing protein, partial [Polyangiales bacterium]